MLISPLGGVAVATGTINRQVRRILGGSKSLALEQMGQLGHHAEVASRSALSNSLSATLDPTCQARRRYSGIHW